MRWKVREGENDVDMGSGGAFQPMLSGLKKEDAQEKENWRKLLWEVPGTAVGSSWPTPA